MAEIELAFPSKCYEAAAKAYLQEHIAHGEHTLHGDSGLDNAESYDQWLEMIKDARTREIHSMVFFAIRKADRKLVGTINVRHPYVGYVQKHGHIGYGVRPSERRKGYATAMLKMALAYCREIGLDRVLLTCDRENLASAKTIAACLGVLETETPQDDGRVLQRYWIAL